MARDDGRYRINDEPARRPLPGFQLLVFLSAPLTVYLALSYLALFIFLPGVIGVIIGGRHRWFDPLLCLCGFVLNLTIGLVFKTWDGVEQLHGLAVFYLLDIATALVFLPVFYVVWQQQRTLQLREAAAL